MNPRTLSLSSVILPARLRRLAAMLAILLGSAGAAHAAVTGPTIANNTFASIAVGQSETQTVILTLTSPEVISSIALHGGASSEYTVESVTGCTLGGSTPQPIGTVCNVSVKFAPLHPGSLASPSLSRNATLLFTDGDANVFAYGLAGAATQAVGQIAPGTVTLFAGLPYSSVNTPPADNQLGPVNGGYAGNNGPAASATFDFAPYNPIFGIGIPANATQPMAFDSAGNLYVIDLPNYVIRKIDNSPSHIVTVVAGTPQTEGYSGNGGLATSATLYNPHALTLDAAGNIYFLDSLAGANSSDGVIRRIDAATGIITAIAGENFVGTTSSSYDAADGGGSCPSFAEQAPGSYSCGDGGLSSYAYLNQGYNLALDSAGNFYLYGQPDVYVRKIAAATGIITTIASSAANSINAAGALGGMTLASDGNLYLLASSANGALFDLVEINLTTQAITSTPFSNSFGPPTTYNIVQQQAGVPLGSLLVESTDTADSGELSSDASGNIYLTASVGTRSGDQEISTLRINLASQQAFMEVVGGGQGGASTNYSAYYISYIQPISVIPDNSGNLFFTTYNQIAELSGSNGVLHFGSFYDFTPAGSVNPSNPPEAATYVNVGNGAEPPPTYSLSSGTNFVIYETGDALACDKLTTLSGGASCDLDVGFSPIAVGLLADTLDVTASGQSLKVSVDGTGVAQGQQTVTPATIAFGNQAINTTSAPQTFRITDTGTGPLDVEFHIDSTTFGIFAVAPGGTCTQGSDTVLQAGQSCTVNITFTPTATGPYSGYLYIESNISFGDTSSVSGMGIAPPTLAIANNVSFDIPVGQTQTQNVSLTINSAVPITSIAVSPNFSEYTLGAITGCTVDATGNTIEPAGTVCTIPVTFTPVAPGKSTSAAPLGRSAPLLVTDIESAKPVGYTFPLEGTATGPLGSFYPGTVSVVAPASFAGCTQQTDPQGDGCPASDVDLQLSGTAVDAAGNIFVLEQGFTDVRRIDAKTGTVTTIAGQHGQQEAEGTGDGGAATSAGFYVPRAIAVDSQDNVYVGDYLLVRKINAATGVITAIAGDGTQSASKGGPAVTTAIPTPITAIVVDPAGDVFFSTEDGTLYRVDGSSGLISFVVGNGTGPTYPATGIPGPASAAHIGDPLSLALDSAANLYIADQQSGVVYQVSASTGMISVYSGTPIQPGAPNNGCSSDTGDGGLATAAFMSSPFAIAVDPADNLYVADGESGACPIRRVDAATGLIHTVAGNNTGGPLIFSAADTSAFDTDFNELETLSVDPFGNLLVSNQGALYKINSETASIFFPTERSGTVSNETNLVTLTNIGVTTALTFDNEPFPTSGPPYTTYPVVGSDPEDCASAGPLAPGASCGIGVSFGPTGNGTFNGAVTVGDNNLNDPTALQTVSLLGTVQGYNKVTEQPNPLVFPSEPVGTPTTLDITITDSNILSTTPAPTVSFIQGDTTSFSTGTITCTPLAGGGSTCTVPVIFTPQAAGPLSCTLVIQFQGALPFEIPVSGTGTATTAPQAVLSPTSLTFPNTTVGSSAVLTTTLSNPGNATLTVSSIVPTDTTDFSESDNCAGSVAAGGSCTVTVTFTPSSATTFSATLNVTDNASNSPQSATLAGAGAASSALVAQLQFTPAQLTPLAGSTTKASPQCKDAGDGGPALQATFCGPYGTAEDMAGNLYIADETDNYVRKVDTTGTITAFAGSPSLFTSGNSGDGGPATAALLSSPVAIAFDSAGNVYIDDSANGRIRKVDSGGTITEFVGGANGTYFNPGTSGSAVVLTPGGITFDPSNNLYIADENQHIVVKVTPAGLASVIAGVLTPQGPGVAGYNGDNIPANTADLNDPNDVISDANGNIFIADTGNFRVRRVDAVTGIITTVAGNGTQGDTGDTGLATNAEITAIGVTVNLAGDLFINTGFSIRKVDASGIITTVAGGGTGALTEPATQAQLGSMGIIRTGNDGSLLLPSASVFYGVLSVGPNGLLDFGSVPVGSTSAPQTVTFENTGNTALALAQLSYTASANFNVAGGTCSGLATLAPAATCTLTVTFAPTSAGPLTGSIGVSSNSPDATQSIALEGTGTQVTAPQAVLTPTTLSFPNTTVGSSSVLTTSLSNPGNATLTIASIVPSDTTDFSESDHCAGSVAAGANCTITITFTPSSATTFNATLNVTDNASNSPQSATLSGTGTPAAPTATLTPNPLVFPLVYVNSPTATTATLTNTGATTLTGITVSIPAGTGFTPYIGTTTCGSTLAAGANCAIGIEFYPSNTGAATGSLSVSDSAPNSPQTIVLSAYAAPEPAAQVQFTPTQLNAIAGTGTAPAGCVDPAEPGSALQTQLCAPSAAAGDTSGNIYIVEQAENVVKILSPSGNLTTFAGTENSGPGSFSGDNGLATAANLSQPSAVAVDLYGNVYISDTGNGRIREVNTTTGAITTFVGGGTGRYFNGGTGTAVNLAPDGIVFDSNDNLYIAEPTQQIVVKVTPAGVATLFAGVQSSSGLGIAGYNGDNIQATTAELNAPTGVAVDRGNNVYIADSQNFRIRYVNVNFEAGMISTAAGNGMQGDTGDGGSSTNAEINPLAIAMNGADDIFISDGGAIRKVDGQGNINTFAGGGTGGPGGPATSALLAGVGAPGIDSLGDVIIPVLTNPQVLSAGPKGILQFGSVQVGTTSAPLTVTLEDTGANYLNFSSNSYPNSGDFTITGGTCFGPFDSFNPGDTCTFIVTFTPSATGSRTGTLSVPTNANGSPSVVLFQGTGAPAATAPVASLAPTALTFPSTSTGSTATALSTVLTNTGTATLNISGVTLSDTSDFTVSANTCGSTLAAGANCSISVTFTPSSATSFTASLSVADNATGSPQSVALTGTGTAPLVPQAVLAPTTLAFPSTNVGSNATALTTTLSNPGNTTLAISGITLAGANSADFKISANTCGSTLATGSSCAISVTFSPASVASFTASISVADNAANTPQTVTLTGTGTPVASDFAITPTTQTLQVQAGGATSDTINLAGIGGPFNNPITLTASGLPKGVTYTFTPGSVTPGSAGASSVFAVNTSSLLFGAVRHLQAQRPWLAGLLLLPLAGLTRLRKIRRSRLVTVLLVVVSLAPILALSGCAGGYYQLSPQTYIITITGASGSLQHSTSVTLTVE